MGPKFMFPKEKKYSSDEQCGFQVCVDRSQCRAFDGRLSCNVLKKNTIL
jgi:hypothetical protein